MTPLSGLLWSMSRPSGIGAHMHVGEGHVGTVGKEGLGGGALGFGRVRDDEEAAVE